MIIHDVEQNTPEWFALRCGIPTASEFSKILTSTGKDSTQSKGYMHTLVGERLAGEPLESVNNVWMERGKELEADALSYFEFETDLDIESQGFITNDDLTLGCSPDGFSGDWGVEVKCPKGSTHVEYLLGRRVPPVYFPQVQGSMYVTGVDHWWFVSYHPKLDPLIIRVQRDEEWINKLEIALTRFNNQLNVMMEKLNVTE